jgi:glucokinase
LLIILTWGIEAFNICSDFSHTKEIVMAEVVIGVDLGGTRLRAARLDKNLNILQRNELLTEAEEGLEATLGRIKSIIKSVWSDSDTILGIGISVPGPCNPETGVVVAPPNLAGWHNVPLSQILVDEFKVPAYVGNDANVAALAESALGSAKGYRHSIYLTVSTGIGSGIINDGKLILGTTGIGNEAGHMIMLVEGDRISTLEKEGAGPALARHAKARIEAGEKSTLTEMCGGNLDEMDGKMVGDAALAGDKVALEVVKRAGKIVGLGLVSLLHIFNPQIVVIGGGVSYIGEIWFEEVRKAVRENVIDEEYWKNTPIIASQISEDVSVLGAATLVVTKGGQKKIDKAMRKLGQDDAE